ncbi:MAG TPA: CBS domain-containing protein [Spirochaetota bacterium]|nr:CBS domain-containing protein [Spirochaetota bacterium]HPF07431.1 CBS domain-containing protein [Spirochaetota bacterium]HPJ43404.1 CBS domain-containing protein [Spirochaetota bacterium]HPR38973.1 CBS domain-containing protein [Spirochaetota bacterium]HRX48420.1 CBS domain-containing protein [Spirochaetota bacterium]
MFHIHTLNGDHFDLTLEALLHRKDVKNVGGKNRVRKFINGEHVSDSYSGAGHTLTYAEKSYREAINIKNEREPLFHAYQIMNSPVKTIPPDMKITEVWNLFKSAGIYHAPVVTGENRIEGIVSDRDLLKSLIIENDRVVNRTDGVISDIMVREVITAGRFTDIRRIAKVMFDEHIGSMPVLDDNRKLEGIITRSDILHALVNYPPLKLWG